VGKNLAGSVLRTGIPMLVHLVGRHFEIEGTFDTNLPFRLKREGRFSFAAPMNLCFDSNPWNFPWAVAFFNAIVALTI
jgi:hypothetical protein